MAHLVKGLWTRFGRLGRLANCRRLGSDYLWLLHLWESSPNQSDGHVQPEEIPTGLSSIVWLSPDIFIYFVLSGHLCGAFGTLDRHRLSYRAPAASRIGSVDVLTILL